MKFVYSYEKKNKKCKSRVERPERTEQNFHSRTSGEGRIQSRTSTVERPEKGNLSRTFWVEIL